MTFMNPVRGTLRCVIPYMQDVQMDSDAAERVADSLASNGDLLNSDSWLKVSPFDLDSLADKERLGFIFPLDTIRFCYWGESKWTVEYKGENYDGAQAMLACLGKSIEAGKPIYDPNYIAHLSRDDLEEILEGSGELKLIGARHSFLVELGNTIVDSFGGDYMNVLDACDGDAVEFANVLTDNLVCFRDFRVCNGETVYFNKRAQLLAGDVSALVRPLRTEGLTACADYKLPQVLRRENVIRYSSYLASKVDSGIEIPEGSCEEVEIRASTIFGIKMIRNSLRIEGIDCTEQDINDQVWLMSQKKRPDDKPYHHTVTTSY